MAYLRYLVSFLSITILSQNASAQISSLPACGQTCISNELGKAAELGCSSIDTACLCSNVDFGFGIRDCVNQACDTSDAAQVISFAIDLCKSAGVNVGSDSTPIASASSQVSSIGEAEIPSSAITTYAIVTTLIDAAGLPTETSTIGSTTIFAIGGTAITDSGNSETKITSPSPTSPSTTPSTKSQSTESKSTTSLTSSTLTTQTPTSSQTPSPTSTPTTKSSNSLTTGSKIGIGIGVPLGVLILGVLIYIATLLHPQHQRKHPAAGEERYAGPGLPELGPGLVPEMQTVERPVELDAKKRGYWDGHRWDGTRGNVSELHS